MSDRRSVGDDIACALIRRAPAEAVHQLRATRPRAPSRRARAVASFAALLGVVAAAQACAGKKSGVATDTTSANVTTAASTATSMSHPTDSTAASGAVATAAKSDVTPSNAGFAGPENLVYDSVADVYLVSNVNGGPVARDGNGFVSRVDSAGRVIAQKWIDGSRATSRLDAPKGLAIHGDTLVIADVGVVRLFNRRTGAPIGVWQTPGVLLNDVSFAPDGTLYVTDTQGRDSVGAIYHFDRGGHASRVAAGAALDGPDGIVALPDGGVLYATFGGSRVARVEANGATTTFATLPAQKVDGLRRLADGSYVVTSWDAHTVYHLLANATLQPLLTGVTSPAGVAIDSRRHTLAVTSMTDNKMYLVTLH